MLLKSPIVKQGPEKAEAMSFNISQKACLRVGVVGAHTHLSVAKGDRSVGLVVVKISGVSIFFPTYFHYCFSDYLCLLCLYPISEVVWGCVA